MMLRALAGLLAGLAVFATADAAPVTFPAPVGDPLDLGGASLSGAQAFADIPERRYRIRRALACGNELTFIWRFNNALQVERTLGAEGDIKDAGWPNGYLLAKAASLAFQDTQARDASCQAPLRKDAATLQAWRGLLEGDDPLRSSSDVVAVVNKVFTSFFGDPCGQVAHGTELTVDDQCLMAQIRRVMLEDLHGPWSIDEDSKRRLPRYPGTDPREMPCATSFSGVNNALGDWDMSVIEYTRLAQLLDRIPVRDRWPALAGDVRAVRDRLDTRFLSIRGPPAREQFNLLYSCGNTDQNWFGSAADTAAGVSGRDGGKYDEEAEAAVSGRERGSDGEDLLKDLWKLFKALAILAALLGIGALLGAAAAAIAGALPAGAAAAAAASVLLVASSTVLIATLVAAFSSIPETENHLLMQNSSAYLKNKRMMRELRLAGDREAFDIIALYNEEVRIWLLERLQEIVEDDFREYNSKPYARLSHWSLLNLIDHACATGWSYEPTLRRGDDCDPKDQAVVRAAAAAYDLSAAKAALGSNQGRRLIPYRRLATENFPFGSGDRSILELFSGADHLLAALQVWTGETRHGPASHASFRSLGHMVWYATSRYRPDPIILGVAIDKSTPYEQQFEHHTKERYSSGPRWLLTAGGDDEAPAEKFQLPLGIQVDVTGLGLAPTKDRGVGVATTLMVSQAAENPARPYRTRSRVSDFIRFNGDFKTWDGVKEVSYSDNGCVTGSFACGLRLVIPADIDTASCRLRPDPARGIFFIDSEVCPAFLDGDGSAAGEFFLLVYRNRHKDGRNWGFIEVAEKSVVGGDLQSYAARVIRANLNNFGSWNGSDGSDDLEFVSAAQNRTIEFEPEDEDFGADHRACGGVINHQGGARFTISSPAAPRRGACTAPSRAIVIDLEDAEAPKRSGRGFALEPLFRGDR